MHIRFDGVHDTDDALANVAAILKLFRERYGIARFREMHLDMTLVDHHGEDVELVDDQTEQPFRYFKVHQQQDVPANQEKTDLKLIIDNTNK